MQSVPELPVFESPNHITYQESQIEKKDDNLLQLVNKILSNLNANNEKIYTSPRKDEYGKVLETLGIKKPSDYYYNLIGRRNLE